MSTKSRLPRWLELLLRFLGSYGLAIVVMFFLFIDTLIGTLEQRTRGLYEVQRLLFNATFFMYDIPGTSLRIPIPGVYLLLVIFSINLLVGGIVRTPWRKEKWGNLVIHIGILFMVAGGGVTYHFAHDGQMTLAEQQTSNRFESYHDWEFVIAEHLGANRLRERVVNQDELMAIRPGQEQVFNAEELPFSIALNSYARNAEVIPIDATMRDFMIQPVKLELENERNLPAVRLRIIGRDGTPLRETALWGNSMLPLEFTHDGRRFEFELRKQTWEIPFSIKLIQFRHEYHPGTRIASTYESDVVKIENGGTQDILIRMNEPLRHHGYTFFQASFTDDEVNGVTSTFAVVHNPSDHWPLYGLILISIGLLVHFGMRLSNYLKRERRVRA